MQSAKRGYQNAHFNKPPSGSELPRPSGIASMFRLPIAADTKGRCLEDRS